MRWTHVIQKFLQVLLQLKKVDGCDETFSRFGQAVSGQLDDLVVDEAQDPVGQRQNALGTICVDENTQPALHLRRGLTGTNKEIIYEEKDRLTDRQINYLLILLFLDC